MSNIKSKFRKGLIWSVGGEFGYLIISLIVNIILARILGPEEFGVMAIAYFFIAISQVLSESGLSGALVRKPDATEIDNSTIFIFNLGVSIILYILLYFGSSFVESFYEVPKLGLYLKVLGILLLINAFRIIQQVKLVKALDYRTISKIKLLAVSISSILAIILAMYGLGIWALILMQLLNALITTVLFWITQGNLQKCVFSIESFKELYSFGLFTTLSSLLDTAFDNVYQLILGKYFSLNQTGLYYQGKKLTGVSVSLVKSTTIGVVFAALSKIQNDKKQFDAMYTNTNRIFTVIVGVICMLIYIYATEILLITYGHKWLGAAFFMKVLAVAYFFYMQEMFNRNIFKVFNRTKLIFYLELIKKSIVFFSLVIGVYYRSIELLMYGYMISYAISYYINYYVSRTVYKSKSTFYEMSFTLKTIAVSIFIILFITALNKVFILEGLNSLLFLPLILFLYTILLSLLKVLDIKRDLNLLIDLRKLE